MKIRTSMGMGLVALMFSAAMPSVSWAAHSAIVADHVTADTPGDVIDRQWLDKARSFRVLFGHQSVGYNVLSGLRMLSRQDPDRFHLALHDRQDGPSPAGGVAQFAVGRNGDPQGKIEDFARRMAGAGGNADVAMMKLCFVDIQGRGADPRRIFESYRDTMERLERAHPHVRFVWWTQPLTTRDNTARNDFNSLVRSYAAAHGKPLFDIADIESHDPRGAESLAGGTPALYPGFTEDGGHLTRDGQLRAARAWWWLMARLAGWPGSDNRGVPLRTTPRPVADRPPSTAGNVDWWGACAREREQFCRDVQPGGGRVVRCLDEHEGELFAACRQARSSGGRRE